MKTTLKLVLLVFCVMLMVSAHAQKKKKNKEKEAVTDSTESKPKKKDWPKDYKDFMDSTDVSQVGLYGVYKVKDKWYFEIADSLMGREIMSVSRYSRTAAGGSIYGGELVNRQVVKWEKGPKNNIFLKSVSYVVMSPDSTKPIAQAVRNSSADPIVGAFEIKATRKDSVHKYSTYVIDVSSIFEGDEQVFSMDPLAKQRLNITSLKKDRSFITSIKTYPINTEVKTVKTFDVSTPQVKLKPTPTVGQYLPASRDAGVLTMEFNTSMILLPKVPMKKRLFDARVGFFANEYEVFGENSQKAKKEVFAVRWRLVPKDKADAERQERGELIEPAKPIVYYIDPATPDQWKPFIKQGIDDWRVAFENAGWKNAIRGEYWPEDDSTMSLEDARFSVVRYFASPISNAYGPNVHDPRSGEILESHIGWYHNVMRLLRNWYLVQAAAVEPKARKMEYNDELMGQLIRFVSSHEVGHTLGLRHNMGASSATPVERLRDNEWLKKHGHTSSIMDYARFNYVAQPEDSIDVENLFPRIGAYDKWAIKWGYSHLPADQDAEADKLVLNEWVKKAYENRALWFGTEISPYDPRYQTEDLGDNAMLASGYGIENLKRILPNLLEWSHKTAEPYKELDELNKAVQSQFRRYMGHVIKNIGGLYDSPKTYDMPGVQFEMVPKGLQKDALRFLSDQLFDTPKWLYESAIYQRTSVETGTEDLKALQSQALEQVLDGERLARILEHSAENTETYTVDELLTDLDRAILKEIKAKGDVDMYRRNLQKVYVSKLIDLLEPGKAQLRSIPVGVTYGFESRTVDLSETDLPSIVRGHLLELETDLGSHKGIKDPLAKYHYIDLQRRVEKALKSEEE